MCVCLKAFHNGGVLFPLSACLSVLHFLSTFLWPVVVSLTYDLRAAFAYLSSYLRSPRHINVRHNRMFLSRGYLKGFLSPRLASLMNLKDTYESFCGDLFCHNVL